MKTIDSALLDSIAGGRGNNGGDRTDNGGRSRNRNDKSGGRRNGGDYYNKQSQDVKDCNNGIIGGMLAGSASGLLGLGLGLVGGAIAGGCFNNKGANGDNNSSAGNNSSNCNGSIGGSCRI